MSQPELLQEHQFLRLALCESDLKVIDNLSHLLFSCYLLNHRFFINLLFPLLFHHLMSVSLSLYHRSAVTSRLNLTQWVVVLRWHFGMRGLLCDGYELVSHLVGTVSTLWVLLVQLVLSLQSPVQLVELTLVIVYVLLLHLVWVLVNRRQHTWQVDFLFSLR